MAKRKCACGNLAHHEIWGDDTVEYLCCVCYIRGGGPPADWHPDCMREVGRLDETVPWYKGEE